MTDTPDALIEAVEKDLADMFQGVPFAAQALADNRHKLRARLTAGDAAITRVVELESELTMLRAIVRDETIALAAAPQPPDTRNCSKRQDATCQNSYHCELDRECLYPDQPPALDEWRSMDTAPKDGTVFQCEIPGEGSDFVVQWHDGLEGKDGPCGGWAIASDQEPPACWTDGICWETNEDGVPSKQPTRWKPQPPALDRDGIIEACAAKIDCACVERDDALEAKTSAEIWQACASGDRCKARHAAAIRAMKVQK
jgi:hypothetical protein